MSNYSIPWFGVDWYFWIGIGLIAVEAVILALGNWTCPLTHIARKYTDATQANFDIFIPNWIAANNILIYSILFAIMMAIVLTNRLF